MSEKRKTMAKSSEMEVMIDIGEMSPVAIRLIFRLRIVRAAMSAMYLKGFILKYIGIAVNAGVRKSPRSR